MLAALLKVVPNFTLSWLLKNHTPMRRTIIDEPEKQQKPADEASQTGNILAFALGATSALVFFISLSQLPPLSAWQFDPENTHQTWGQCAFLLSALLPVSFWRTRRWYVVLFDKIWLFPLLLGSMVWLCTCNLLVTKCFGAEPGGPCMRPEKLQHLVVALVLFVVTHIVLAAWNRPVRGQPPASQSRFCK